MKKTITTGSDFSGVGAFDYAIGRIAEQKGFEHKRIYACDWDKYARITYAHNHGTPEYYPKDVYDRTIAEESLDIYMTSPPCQSFSLAGKREGKNSDKGVLFFNSHEFIKKNKPRFFIFENVKGLLSDDNGRTFQEWLNYLGGKSLNGLPLLFKDENAVDYHVYYKVLNSKKHGVPQNRERIFIVGIRDDADNVFQFPKEEHLILKLKDVLETEVDEKYFLSEKAIKSIILNENNLQQSKVNPKIATTLQTPGNSCGVYKGMTAVTYPFIADYRTDEGLRIRKDNNSPCLQATMNDGFNLKSGRNPPLVGVNNLGGDLSQNIQIAEIRSDEGLRFFKDNICGTIRTIDAGGEKVIVTKSKIRRLTPRECFRLQDFPDTFDFSVVSDSQAYKQAGNSITVRVLELILNKLKL